MAQDTYETKSDVKRALISFHHKSQRSFEIIASDKRRYYFKCSKGNECGFKLHYNLTNGVWIKGKHDVPHSCVEDPESMIVVGKSVEYLCGLKEVQEWMNLVKREASTQGLKFLLSSLGYNIEYHTLKRCLNKLREERFGKDTTPRKRGRPKKTAGEHQLTIEYKRSQRCRICKEIGHNQRSCNKANESELLALGFEQETTKESGLLTLGFEQEKTKECEPLNLGFEQEKTNESELLTLGFEQEKAKESGPLTLSFEQEKTKESVPLTLDFEQDKTKEILSLDCVAE